VKALVVAPTATARRAILMSLAPLGWDAAIEASDVQEACEHPDGPAELVIVAWSPPRLDAPEVVRAVLAHADWKGSRAIVLGARSRIEDVRRALDAGASDYLLVPFEPETLRARAAHWMNSVGPTGEATEREAA
jgi:two-component system chemotaxis response regulator CheY